MVNSTNITFEWAPPRWLPSPPVPVWTKYFQAASPNVTVEPTDIRNCSANLQSNIMAVTFDDGPSTFTPLLLDYFQKINMHTTFFTIGSEAIKQPQILLDAFNAGHQIAVHTWSHPELPKLSNDEIVSEIVYSAKAIYSITGQVPKYFRPPFGESDDRVRRLATQMGLTSIGFFDTDDWQFATTNPGIVTGHYRDWMNARKNGLITLHHDIHPAEVQVGMQAVDLVIRGGYTVERVFECLGDSSAYGNSVLEGFFLSGQFDNKDAVVPVFTGVAKTLNDTHISATPTLTQSGAYSSADLVVTMSLLLFIALLI